MSPVLAVATYLIFWVITLFVVLPIGVRTAREEGDEPVAGHADSAPVNPLLAKKAILTTIIATLLFALYYANYVNGWIRLEDIPGWQDSGPYRPG
jgi:predicted secreted protein